MEQSLTLLITPGPSPRWQVKMSAVKRGPIVMWPRYFGDPLTFTSCALSGSVFSAFSETSENHLMDSLRSWYDQIHGAERMTPVISLLIGRLRDDRKPEEREEGGDT